MANQRGRLQTILEEEDEVERNQRPNTMEEAYYLRGLLYSKITIEANNFELKPALITMEQQHQFTGHLSEDPNDHMGRFTRMANTIKLNGGETRSNQAETLPIFIGRCGSNMV